MILAILQRGFVFILFTNLLTLKPKRNKHVESLNILFKLHIYDT